MGKSKLPIIGGSAKKEGAYAWKKKTAADGDFLCFVTSDDANAYPNGGMQDGYYYKRISTSDLPIQYSYSGTSKLTTGFDSSNNPIWTLKLLTSGTLNISEMETTIVDAFLVGGGGGGGGGVDADIGSSGAGGGGGYTTTSLNTPISVNTDYTVQIGAGGSGGIEGNNGSSGGKTSAFGLSANGGGGGQCGSYRYGANGGAGGSGGGAGAKMDRSSFSGGKAGTGQGKSTRAFEETSETLYAGGGGGGGAYTLSGSTVYAGTGGDGGSNGGSGKVGTGPLYSEASATPGAGGSGGGGTGGNGGYNGSQDGKNGAANTGSGGGGGGSHYFGSNWSGRGGAGGSGIVIIRGRYV